MNLAINRIFPFKDYFQLNHDNDIDPILDYIIDNDYNLYLHLFNTAKLSLKIYKTIFSIQNQQDMLDLATASLIHDVGKILIDDKILNQKDSLSKMQKEKIKKHVFYIKTVLDIFEIEISPNLNKIIFYAKLHHEKNNGRGYPYGLKEQEIPLITQIISVCDIYEALTSGNRIYKSSFSKMKTYDIMKKMVVNGYLNFKIFNILF